MRGVWSVRTAIDIAIRIATVGRRHMTFEGMQFPLPDNDQFDQVLRHQAWARGPLVVDKWLVAGACVAHRQRPTRAIAVVVGNC